MSIYAQNVCDTRLPNSLWGQTAMVKLIVHEDKKRNKFIDYLSLYKFQEDWKLMTKLFTMNWEFGSWFDFWLRDLTIDGYVTDHLTIRAGICYNYHRD